MEKSFAESINYTPGDTQHMNAAVGAMKSITARLDKAAQARTEQRTEALQCMRLLLDKIADTLPTSGDGTADEPPTSPAAALSCLSRTTKQFEGVKKN